MLNILVNTLERSPNNRHLLADCSQASSSQFRSNKAVIASLQTGKLPDLKEPTGCLQDILFQLILIGLNYDLDHAYLALQMLGHGT